MLATRIGEIFGRGTMTSVIVIFFVSIIVCCAIAYMLGLLWFSDIRNRRFQSFFILGIGVFFWTLLNAITMVVDVEYFSIMYTIRMIAVCVIPFAATWFLLNFTNSRLKDIRFIQMLLLIIPSVDILIMLLNPLHHLYFLNYDNVSPERGPIFYVHLALNLLFVVIAFIILIRFIIKEVRSNPILLLTGVGMIAAYALNFVYITGAFPFPHDTTPLGFFFALLMFTIASYKLRLFNIKTALFASTMDTINDLIILFNENQNIMDANQHALKAFPELEHMLGRENVEAFLTYINNMVSDDESTNLLGHIKDVPRLEGECSIHSQDGTLKTYTVVWNTVFERKKISGYILMLSDVSSYIQQNQKLFELKELAEAASTTKGEFLSRMSHEMRTPMNTIIGMTEVVLRNNTLDNSVKESVEKIQGASTHLLGVINDVLDMSKIESGKFTLFESEITREKLLKNIFVIADIQAEKKQQYFETIIDENVPTTLIVDSQRLTQVITNLLSNAFKFTPEKGRVTFSIKMEQRQDEKILLRFEVRDNGIGISKEQQMHLFMPFEQADGSISRNFGGTGLGLAISKNIVDLMDGEIWIESELGVGSSFIFTVWAKEGDNNDSVQENSPDDDGYPDEFAGCNILLAEDMVINREVIFALLEGSGIIFDVAENGRIAYEKYLAAPDSYDLIFMDIQMPEMDGFTATKSIRASGLPSAKTIPIIAMTANVFKEDIDACLEAGMNSHIAKPIETRRVREIVRKYYHNKH